MARRTATGPNGEKLELVDGQWRPMAAPTSTPVADEGSQYGLPYAPRGEPGMQPSGQGARTAMASFLANLLSLPHATGELLSAGAALPALVPGGKSFSEARAAQEKLQPAAGLLALPDPASEDILAMPAALGRAFGNANANSQRSRELWKNPNATVPPLADVGVRSNFSAARAEEEKRSADAPLDTAAGRVLGDVATLMTLKPGRRATELLGMNPRAELSAGKGVLDAAARSLLRGTARTAEAGFDGAVLGALSDGDPVKTAVYAAGVQAGGSMALAAKNSFFRNPLKSVAALYLGHEMWKAIAPGPQDFFESKDTAVAELVAAYGLGSVAAVAGSARGTGPGNVQRIADALSSASRATIASVVTQLQEAAGNNQPQYARVLELLGQDQERFGTDVRVRLERAARSDKPRALLNEIDTLMQSTRFRKAMDDAEAEVSADVSRLGAAANSLGRESAPQR